MLVFKYWQKAHKSYLRTISKSSLNLYLPKTNLSYHTAIEPNFPVRYVLLSKKITLTFSLSCSLKVIARCNLNNLEDPAEDIAALCAIFSALYTYTVLKDQKPYQWSH